MATTSIDAEPEPIAIDSLLARGPARFDPAVLFCSRAQSRALTSASDLHSHLQIRGVQDLIVCGGAPEAEFHAMSCA